MTPFPRRAAARAVAPVLLGLLAVTAAATGASAHARLVETVPTDGATVGAVPAPVTLTFTDPLDPAFVRVRATGPGDTVLEATVATKRDSVEVTLPDAGPGAYTVVYRVVSKDGHPVSGRTTFTVAAAPAAGSSGSIAPATPSASTSEQPQTTTQTTQTQQPTSAGPTPIGSGSVSGEISGPDLPVTYLVGLVAVVVALGTAAWAAVARRGR